MAVRLSACAEVQGPCRCSIVHLLVRQAQRAVQSPQHLTHLLRGPDYFDREIITDARYGAAQPPPELLETKECRACQQQLPAADFARHALRAGGL